MGDQIEQVREVQERVRTVAEEPYITKHQLASRLTKSVRTIENWQRRGYLPFVKVGQSVLFRYSDVVAHLQRNFGVKAR